MTVSQNGFSANHRDLVSPRYVPDTRVRLVVRNGPAGDLLLEVASLFDRLVQDIDATADDWGYAERPIRGATTLSNHASGTAIDLNATCWSLGQPASVNLDPGQIAQVRAIVAATVANGRPVVRWGGDYQGRKDPMHFEIADNRTETDCAAALAALRAHFTEDDMSAETERMIAEMYREMFYRLPNRRGPAGGEIPGGGDDTTLGYAANADGFGYRIEAQLDELVAAIRAIPGGTLDTGQLATAIAADLARRLSG